MSEKKLHKTVVRLALLYKAGTWPLKRIQEKKLNVAEIRMLRRICGGTRAKRIQNKWIRGTVEVMEAKF